ncbi:CD99 molecule [Neosynchiropus ocellatus]
MKFVLRITVLAFLLTGTFSQNAAPSELIATPLHPRLIDRCGLYGLDLLDAFGPDEPEKPKPPKSGGLCWNGFNLDDALGPDDPKKPAVNPARPGGGGGGGSFSDSDLFDVNNGNYEPDGGRSSGGNPGYDSNGGAEQPKESSGAIAAIASSIGVALLGAASSYFAYQKKKLCFKLQGGQDPESGKHHGGNHGDNQVFSNLMRNS